MFSEVITYKGLLQELHQPTNYFICFRFLELDWKKDSTVFVAVAPCTQLAQKHWIFWKNNSLILTPQTKGVAPYLDINYNSRIYHIDSNQTVFEIYKYQLHDLNYTEQRIGESKSPSMLAKSSFIWERRTNLSSIHLNITYISFPPVNIKLNDSGNVTGVYAELFFALQKKLGFSYSLNLQKENQWGSLDDNGSYDGLFGHLQKGEANWSIAHTSVNAERSTHFDFSLPILKDPKKIVTRRPQGLFDAFAYLIVFSNEFWMVLLFSALVLTLFVYWILRLDSINDTFQSNHLSAAFAFTILSLFCRENFPLESKWSGKIICLVVLFWGFLISTSYNAILTSALATPRANPTINSLEDLLNSPDYTLIFLTSGATREHFQKAQNNTTGKFQMMK